MRPGEGVPRRKAAGMRYGLPALVFETRDERRETDGSQKASLLHILKASNLIASVLKASNTVT